MFKFLFQCIRNFGILHGLSIHFQIKIRKSNKIRLPHCRFPIYLRQDSGDITTFREIFLRREYDVDLPAGIIPSVIIDAGANIGYTSIFFANKYPQARILALEPQKENFAYLKRNTSSYSQITALHTALWNNSGAIEIIDKGYGVRGFVVGEAAPSETVTTLPAITLIDLIVQFKITAIDILKIDIEGSEKEVFSENYEKWIPITKCIIIELHDRMKEGASRSVFHAISQFNFDFSVRGENLIFINKDL